VRAFIIGTAGHVDHGKTTLVRALTGVDTDRWREEKERGLTIDLGFARLPTGEGSDLEIGMVDVPGHEDFVKNMLAGATGIDLLLLVVAADEGPMPQTREHLVIARLLGVKAGVVALTKVDRVEPEWQELAAETVRDELRLVLGRDDWPVIPVSPVKSVGVEDLREALVRRAGSLEPRRQDDLFRLPVDRAFSVRGAGTVVTGTTWSGRVRVGDDVRLLPGGITARIRTLQVHGQDRQEVGPGRRCALALVGVDADAVSRGTVAVIGAGWSEAATIGAHLTVPSCLDRPIEPGQRVRVYLGTREVMARVDLAHGTLEPGAEGWARLRLERPIVARTGDRFVVRFYSPVAVVAGGRVAEVDPPGDWRSRTDPWLALLEGEPATALAAATALREGRGLTAAEAPLLTGLAPAEVTRAAERAPGVLRVGDRWFAVHTEESCRAALLEDLAELHRKARRARAASLAALRRGVQMSFAGPLIDHCMATLVGRGDVLVEGPRVKLPGHRVQLTPAEEEAREAIVEAVEAGGLEPPMVADLSEGVGRDAGLLHDLLELLVEDERVAAVNPDLYLSPGTERDLRERVRRVLARTTPAQASEFKEALGVSRRYLIPYLEYMDAQGVTRRTSEGRVPGPALQSR